MTHHTGSPELAALLPALGEPVSSLTPLARELAGRGFASDIIGRRARRDFRGHVADARADLERMPGDGPRLLVGASYGGMISIRVAGSSCAPHIAGLVLLDVPHPLSHRTISAAVGRRADAELPNPECVDLTAALIDLGETARPGSLSRLPLLVLSRGPGTWPGDDPDIPMADRVWLAHQRLHTQMSAAATFRVVEGVGHNMGRTHPALVADLIRGWWRQALSHGHPGGA